MPNPILLDEPVDVQRATGMSHGGVLWHVRRGHLKPCAVTRSGRRLFRPADVESFARWRAERSEARS